MSQLTMLYVLPLILGRTFDLNKMQVGVDIFPVNDIIHPRIYNYASSSSEYQVIGSESEANSFIMGSGMSDLFKLRAKAGFLQSGVIDAFINDRVDRRNAVEIAIRARAIMNTHELDFKSKPISKWQQMQGLGTHFVSSITYGHELIASIRFICNSSEAKKRVERALQVSSHWGLGREDKYTSSITDAESVQIKVYSSVPLKEVPTTMDALQRVIKSDFPEAAKKYNNGTGVPLVVELSSLRQLDWTRPDFVQNIDLEVELSDFEYQFSDLLNTKTAIEAWMKSSKQQLSADLEKKVGDLYECVLRVLGIYYEVIGSLDMTSGPEQLNSATQSYENETTYSFYTYYRKYVILRKEAGLD